MKNTDVSQRLTLLLNVTWMSQWNIEAHPIFSVSPVNSGHLGLLLGLYSEVSEPAGERGHLHHHSNMRSGHCTHHISSSACGYLSSVLHEVPQWHIQGISFPVAFTSWKIIMLSDRLIQPRGSIIKGVREKHDLHCLRTFPLVIVYDRSTLF